MALKILFSIHLFPPKHNCGGEYYVVNLAKYLLKKGHECRVLLHQANQHSITSMYNFEGIWVFPPTANKHDFIMRADRVITHLDFTKWTCDMCKIYRRPVYFISHNTHIYKGIAESGNQKINVIYNAQYMKNKLAYKQPSIVLHPPVDYRNYDVVPGSAIDNEFICLVSLSKNKGGDLFYEIAARMPEKKFLGIKGSYDPQIVKPLPNVTVIENTRDILSWYKRIRIILMPSGYESWGMVATEAMCNGIPVICNPTDGLKENCAEAGIYCDRNNVNEWVAAIKKLDDKDYYLYQSKLCRKRSRELDPEEELAEAEKFILHGYQ